MLKRSTEIYNYLLSLNVHDHVLTLATPLRSQILGTGTRTLLRVILQRMDHGSLKVHLFYPYPPPLTRGARAVCRQSVLWHVGPGKEAREALREADGQGNEEHREGQEDRVAE
jgi:hypothetical protein